MRQTIYIDVDDTLVRSFGAKRIPMTSVIESIRRLQSQGALLYLWSSGGSQYCQQTAMELGIADCFAVFLPKPNVYIDDQPVQEWTNCQHLYPSQAAHA
jgi:phosphoglycolate phosphatase-like HAD superfamily hydrolase